MVYQKQKGHGFLYGLIAVILIFQIITFIFVTMRVSEMNSEFNQALKKMKIELSVGFNEKLNEYNNQNDLKFDELNNLFSSQGEEISAELKVIRSSQGDYSGMIGDAKRGVVSVMTDYSAGSGFVIADGYIVTNYHVIMDDTPITILTYEGKEFSAELIGYDSRRDIALLKIARGSGNDYDVLNLASAEDIQVGNKVIAIGNPFGLSFSVTEGIISAVDRESASGVSGYIQTDVSLNQGNSGGPLLSTEGKVVGVNNFKVANAEGLGFALGIEEVKDSINDIQEGLI